MQRETCMYAGVFLDEKEDEKLKKNNYQIQLVPVSYTPLKC